MVKLIEKKNETLKILLRQKGQGLTEFALILAFCAAIGWAASEVGFMDAIGAAFDSGKQPEQVTAAIGGGKAKPAVNWHLEKPVDYFEKDSQAERLKKDQDVLENLAKSFIGKSQKDIATLMGGKTGDMGGSLNGEEILLGWFKPSTTNANGEKVGMKFETNSGANINPDVANEIFKWMQVENSTNDPNFMYLVSDYIVSQGWVDSLGVKGGTQQLNGIRIRFEYDYSSKHAEDGGYTSADQVRVVGVQLAIDPKSQDKDADLNTKEFNRMSSSGLEVRVRWEDDGSYTISHENTVVHTTSSNKGRKDTFENWYGAGDRLTLVKKFIRDNAKLIEHEDVREEKFNKGDMIYIPDPDPTKAGRYYIAYTDGYQMIGKFSSQASIEYDPKVNAKKNNIFVKFTDSNDRYLHENNKTSFNNGYKKLKIEFRGTLITLSNGKTYVYIGDTTPVDFTGITEENKNDYILIREVPFSTTADDGGRVYN